VVNENALFVTGTDQLPARLEFLNHPDSSLMSSFPNTPQHSGENSASSGTSVIDADEAAMLKKPVTMTRACQLQASLKRRFHEINSSRSSSPVKVAAFLVAVLKIQPSPETTNCKPELTLTVFLTITTLGLTPTVMLILILAGSGFRLWTGPGRILGTTIKVC